MQLEEIAKEFEDARNSIRNATPKEIKDILVNLARTIPGFPDCQYGRRSWIKFKKGFSFYNALVEGRAVHEKGIIVKHGSRHPADSFVVMRENGLYVHAPIAVYDEDFSSDDRMHILTVPDIDTQREDPVLYSAHKIDALCSLFNTRIKREIEVSFACKQAQ